MIVVTQKDRRNPHSAGAERAGAAARSRGGAQVSPGPGPTLAASLRVSAGCAGAAAGRGGAGGPRGARGDSLRPGPRHPGPRIPANGPGPGRKVAGSRAWRARGIRCLRRRGALRRLSEALPPMEIIQSKRSLRITISAGETSGPRIAAGARGLVQRLGRGAGRGTPVTPALGVVEATRA